MSWLWRTLWLARTPAARLAANYVAIIMVISILFSVALYRLSSEQLATGLRHQYSRMEALSTQGLGPTPNLQQANDELNLGKRRLASQLSYFNFIILVLASGASYFLAGRTLRPIEEALEAQSRFTADASHELRTPLTAMQTEIEVALRNPALSRDEAVELLHSNLEEVAKLRSLSDGLLQLARGEVNSELFEAVSLEDIAHQAVQQLGPAAALKRVTFDCRADGQRVLGDPRSLVELAVILVENAVKYSSEGSTVTLTSRSSGRNGLLAIADQGQGISAEALPHIFERFYRADSSRSKIETQGYGLGLSIAHKIADMHAGAIHAKSQLGRGSTFTISLPLASTRD